MLRSVITANSLMLLMSIYHRRGERWRGYPPTLTELSPKTSGQEGSILTTLQVLNAITVPGKLPETTLTIDPDLSSE